MRIYISACSGSLQNVMALDRITHSNPVIEVLFEYKDENYDDYRAVVRAKANEICHEIQQHMKTHLALKDPKVFCLCSKGRCTGQDHFILQHWMRDWKTFVNVDSMEQIKNGDRIAVCQVSALSRSSNKVRIYSHMCN